MSLVNVEDREVIFTYKVPLRSFVSPGLLMFHLVVKLGSETKRSEANNAVSIGCSQTKMQRNKNGLNIERLIFMLGSAFLTILVHVPRAVVEGVATIVILTK